ncbi:MAG: helix-turn-helix transcriptional regulator [Bacteroidota bacterium]
MTQWIESLNLPPGSLNQQFNKLLATLEKIDASYLGIVDITKPRPGLYYSRNTKAVSGYEPGQFVEGVNFEFLASITPKKFVPYIANTQARHITDALKPGFDHIAAQIMELDVEIVNAKGDNIPIRYTGLVLTYTKDGGVELLIGVHEDVSKLSERESDRRRLKIISLLQQLKSTYVAMQPKKFEGFKKKQGAIAKIVLPVEPYISLTKKELEILQLIASGLSTKEISNRVSISHHTIETHRKHLLKKFSAKNSVELVKKASKVYWLE